MQSTLSEGVSKTSLKRFSLASLMGLTLFLGCGSPGFDSAGKPNSLEIAAVLGDATSSLNRQDCSGAFSFLLPIYNSAHSTNDIRLLTAATYGCSAKLNILGVVASLGKMVGQLQGAGFWQFLVQTFPSTASPDDGIPEAAEGGIDAASSAINLGSLVSSQTFTNSTGYNPGAFKSTDRIGESNTYLAFLSMTLMGSLLSRYTLPNALHQPTVAIPWKTATHTPGNGCAMASATLFFNDGMTYLASVTPAGTPLAQVYSDMSLIFTTALDAACAAGCGLSGGNVSCTSCPLNLRDRTSCTGVVTDVNSWAAAGINEWVSLTWTGVP